MTLPADLVPISEQTASLGRVFAAAGYALHLVGGSVRDALMGRIAPDADLDLTTDAHPDQILRLIDGVADAIWTTGIEFGTVAARVGGATFEITTYRADRYDRVTRNPEVVFGDNLVD